MNGNKFHLILALLAIALFITQCKTQKETSEDITETATDTAPDTLIPTLPQLQTDTALAEVDTFRLKERYQIAFILPFYLDSLYTDSLKENENYFHRDAKMATQFFLGAQTALDSLDQLGLKADVHFFDSNNNLGQLVDLKKSGALDSMDLIIGPIYNSNVRYLSSWAQQKQIPLVSPLSPTEGLAKENPYFVQINSSIPTHILNIFELLQHKFLNTNKVLLNRAMKNELDYQRLWKKLADDYNTAIDSLNQSLDTSYWADSIKFNYWVLSEEDRKTVRNNELQEDTLFLNMLQEDSLNVLIINSIDRAFISKLNRNLFKLTEDYNIVVVGLPALSQPANFNLEYLESFNLHYSSDYFVDSSFYHTPFYQNVIDSFSMMPDAFFLKGFDITLWMGQGLMKYGKDLLKGLQGEQLEGIHNNFKLRVKRTDPADPNSALNYLENKHVHLLYLENYEIKNARKSVLH